MAGNRPSGRQKHVTSGGGNVHRRGSGLGGGPVGSGGRPSGSSGGSGGGYHDLGGGSGKGGGGMKRAAGGGGAIIAIIAVIYMLMSGGGLNLSSLTGGGSGVSTDSTLYTNLSGQSGWTDKDGSNTGKLNTDVDSSARDKYTTIQGNGKDEVTIMVYMCGTDLESKSGMATSDLQEMAKATLSDKINLLVYTGGCKKWNNKIISSSKNQIYQVKNGGIKCLKSDMGSDAMTQSSTLSSFIKWCAKNYPADRNDLILWDHGGGSISGYGYDEKNSNAGSMTLSKIKKALADGGMKFDFIGFDACLMATAENAQMLTSYADYLIASEETEPGIGWYYTNWLTNLSKNTSLSTLEIGQDIADDFVDTCAKKCSGQKATLSVVDLAELQSTLPSALSAFSKSTTKMINNDEYLTVSNARSSSREFAVSSKIDQIDLVHFADKIGSDEALDLRTTLLSAIKYNRTSSDMNNAYGLSVYFPGNRVSSVDKMVTTYNDIGLDSEYSKCIKKYASMEVSGQAATGGTTNVFPSLFGQLSGSSSSGSSSSYSGSSSGSSYNSHPASGFFTGTGSGASSDSEMMSQLLSTFLGGDFSSISGLTDKNTNFLTDSITEDDENYITENQLNADDLEWTENSEGQQVLELSQDQWNLVQMLELSMYYDDGEGYIDLGLDNVYDFDDDGNLIGENDNTWLAINGQVVSYYFDDQTTDDDGQTIITGHVPAMLNGTRVNLILSFDDEHPNGTILGAQTDYKADTTETISKGLTTLEKGDKLDFLCDYYSYDGEFQDNYYLGEQIKVTDNMEISNVDVGSGDVSVAYRLTDIYNQHYWTPAITSNN